MKSLPYFKFDVSEWLPGISMVDEIPCCLGVCRVWGSDMSSKEMNAYCTCKKETLQEKVDRLEKMIEKYLKSNKK